MIAIAVAGGVLAAAASHSLLVGNRDTALRPYPDTRLSLPRPPLRRDVGHGDAVRWVAFEDQVWPEEDLLQKKVDAPPLPSNRLLPPSNPERPQFDQRAVPPPVRAEPPTQRDTIAPPVDATTPSNQVSPPSWPAIDKHAPPGPDEDLLQRGDPPAATTPAVPMTTPQVDGAGRTDAAGGTDATGRTATIPAAAANRSSCCPEFRPLQSRATSGIWAPTRHAFAAWRGRNAPDARGRAGRRGSTRRGVCRIVVSLREKVSPLS